MGVPGWAPTYPPRDLRASTIWHRSRGRTGEGHGHAGLLLLHGNSGWCCWERGGRGVWPCLAWRAHWEAGRSTPNLEALPPPLVGYRVPPYLEWLRSLMCDQLALQQVAHPNLVELTLACWVLFCLDCLWHLFSSSSLNLSNSQWLRPSFTVAFH